MKSAAVLMLLTMGEEGVRVGCSHAHIHLVWRTALRRRLERGGTFSRGSKRRAAV
jgi:hypothetical protein